MQQPLDRRRCQRPIFARIEPSGELRHSGRLNAKEHLRKYSCEYYRECQGRLRTPGSVVAFGIVRSALGCPAAQRQECRHRIGFRVCGYPLGWRCGFSDGFQSEAVLDQGS